MKEELSELLEKSFNFMMNEVQELIVKEHISFLKPVLVQIDSIIINITGCTKDLFYYEIGELTLAKKLSDLNWNQGFEVMFRIYNACLYNSERIDNTYKIKIKGERKTDNE